MTAYISLEMTKELLQPELFTYRPLHIIIFRFDVVIILTYLYQVCHCNKSNMVKCCNQIQLYRNYRKQAVCALNIIKNYIFVHNQSNNLTKCCNSKQAFYQLFRYLFIFNQRNFNFWLQCHYT